MSDARDLPNEIAWNVFTTGVYVVPYERFTNRDTPTAIMKAWQTRIVNARANELPALRDGHEVGLFVWTHIEGRSFVWMDLGMKDISGGWRAVSRLVGDWPRRITPA